MLLISFYQTSEFHCITARCAAWVCSRGLTPGHTCTQIPSLCFSWPPGFICCLLTGIERGHENIQTVIVSLSCLWQAEQPQCIQLFLISKLTYTFASLKFLVFTSFCYKKFCCLLIYILYARIRHTGTLFNDMIILLFLFSVYSLISLMFFGFCHVNSHRVIEIVIKTLRHFLQVQGHPCVHEEEFFTGQLISWSDLPS